MPDPEFSLRSKSEQLADYLRASITAGRLADPLPDTRRWSVRLGVSRRTLGAAVKQLRQEGWLTVRLSGIRLNRRPGRRQLPRGAYVVRMLMFRPYQERFAYYQENFGALSHRLQLQGVDLRWEIHDRPRLNEIVRQPAAGNELLVLMGLPLVYQRLFIKRGGAVLMLGEPEPGLAMPFINVDASGAVAHATNRLLRHGFKRLVLVFPEAARVGAQRFVASFLHTCAQWTSGGVDARVVPTALDRHSLAQTARQLAEGARLPSGIIVIAPVPVALIATTLLRRRIALPEHVELVAMFHTAEAVLIDPPPTHYPYPAAAVVRSLADVVAHAIAGGQKPTVQKTIVPEIGK